MTEKIEVQKDNGNFTYTGEIEDIEGGWVKIKTIKDEELIFRKEQIIQRRVVSATKK